MSPFSYPSTTRSDVHFLGTGLLWYGAFPAEMARGPATGAYSIDGGPSIPFPVSRPLNPDNNQSEPFQNQLLFATPGIPFGLHNISVSYTSAGTPLSLDYLIIRNTDAPEPPELWVPSSAPPNMTNIPGGMPTGASYTTDRRGSNLPPDSLSRFSAGEIVACLFGACAASALLIIAFVWGRRRYRKRKRPIITPYPGFEATRKPEAPLDVDTVPRRWSTFGDDNRHHRELPKPETVKEKLAVGPRVVKLPPPPTPVSEPPSYVSGMRTSLEVLPSSLVTG